MIEKQLPSKGSEPGAITDGVYKTQVSDVVAASSPEIDVEVVMLDDDDQEPAMTVEIGQDEDSHDVNLLETIFKSDDARQKMNNLASDLVTLFDEDVRSRAVWEKTYRDGLQLLNAVAEERSDPWEGACGVVHPLLTEAVVRFQSEAITETFPAHGPVKVQLAGKQTVDRLAAAERVKEDMNWRLTEEMPEYRVEHERLLWSLPIAGSGFKKVYYDSTRDRQVSMFVPAEDVVVNYGAADLHDADRVTHIMRKSKNWIERMIDGGVYIDDDIGSPTKEADEMQEAKDKVTGLDGINSEQYVLLEMQVDLEIEEKDGQTFAWPYVFTINKSTNRCMAIRRNWREGSAKKVKRQHFVHYTYITGFGFYGFGLVHLIGGHAKAGTSLLRQLVDAGTLANIPGGFKARGLRIKDDNMPHRPGEFKDVDIASGALKDNILPLPYKEPSATLFSLLQSIVEDGRKAANISTLAFSDANQSAPVGTTLALIERQLKTLSAVQARIHAALREEFKLIKALVRDNGQRAYPYEADPDRRTKDSDYDIADIMPVSDPNAATMGVRIAQYQAAFELASKAPQLYDQVVLHREMLQTIGIKNVQKILPMPEEQTPRDPIAENMAVLMSKPLKAFIQQNHQAHILVHQTFMSDPKIGMLLGQNPNAQMMFNAMQAHIAEHTAYMYRDMIQQAMGVELPDPNEPMDPQAEYVLSGLLAQAANTVSTQNRNEQAQAQAQQRMQDPLVQAQMKELALREREVVVKEDKQLLDRQIATVEHRLDPNAAVSPVEVAKAQAIQADAALKQRDSMQRSGLQAAQAQERMQLERRRAEEEQRRANEMHDHSLYVKHAQAVNTERRADEMHGVQKKAALQRRQHKEGDKK